MAKKEFKVVPYEHTLYSKLIENLKGEYFQHIITPHLIAHLPKENPLNIYHIEGGNLSVWFPLQQRHGNISLDEFNHYALITEEQFNEYKDNKIDLQNILLAHKDSKFVKDKNKDNLSAKTGMGYKADKKDADYTTDTGSKDCDVLYMINKMHPQPSDITHIAFDINETARLNKQNKHNLSAKEREYLEGIKSKILPGQASPL